MKVEFQDALICGVELIEMELGQIQRWTAEGKAGVTLVA